MQSERNAGTGWVPIGGAATSVTPTYAAGWADIGGAFAPLRASRTPSGLVTVTGHPLRSGAAIASAATTGVIATLPVGYRPPATIFGAAIGSFSVTGLYRVNIDAAGAITAQLVDGVLTTWTSGGYVALGALAFQAA